MKLRHHTLASNSPSAINDWPTVENLFAISHQLKPPCLVGTAMPFFQFLHAHILVCTNIDYAEFLLKTVAILC